MEKYGKETENPSTKFLPRGADYAPYRFLFGKIPIQQKPVYEGLAKLQRNVL